MSALVEIVEGWTGALPFRLNSDGDPVDLSGLTVSVIVKDGQGGSLYDSTGPVAISESTGGIVTFTPTSSDFSAAKSPYRIRFRVATSSAMVFFPNGDADLIVVKPL